MLEPAGFPAGSLMSPWLIGLEEVTFSISVNFHLRNFGLTIQLWLQ